MGTLTGSPSRAKLAAVALVFVVVSVSVAAPPVQAASRVALLTTPSDDGLVRQATTLLVAELQAAGFEVVEAPRDPARDVRLDIEAAAVRLQPVATYAILPRSDGAALELWLEDRVTGKLVIRRVELGAEAKESAADLALKAVELLRGSLLEVTSRQRAEPAPVPADVARFVSTAVSEPPRHFLRGLGLSAGAGALVMTGLDPAYAPVLRLSWGSRAGRAVRVTLHGFGTSVAVTAPEGSADVRQGLALAEGLLVFRQGARFQPVVGVGGGLLRTRGEGTAATPVFPEGVGTTHAALVTAQAGIAARLGERSALILDATILGAFPSTRILIATREAARSGGLGILAALSLSTVF